MFKIGDKVITTTELPPYFLQGAMGVICEGLDDEPVRVQFTHGNFYKYGDNKWYVNPDFLQYATKLAILLIGLDDEK